MPACNGELALGAAVHILVAGIAVTPATEPYAVLWDMARGVLFGVAAWTVSEAATWIRKHFRGQDKPKTIEAVERTRADRVRGPLPLVRCVVPFRHHADYEHLTAWGLHEFALADLTRVIKVPRMVGLISRGNVALRTAFHEGASVPHRAILIVPGGNYDKCEVSRTMEYATWMSERGLDAYVLWHRVRSDGFFWPAPLEDFKCAF